MAISAIGGKILSSVIPTTQKVAAPTSAAQVYQRGGVGGGILGGAVIKPAGEVGDFSSHQRQKGGWYDNNGKVMQWNGSSFSDGQAVQEPSINFDDLYRPQFELLNKAEQTAKENNQLALGDIDRAVLSQGRDIDIEEVKAKGVFDTASKRTAENKESALSKVIRDYLAIQQNARARFGQGSSAGPAVNDIATQEYYRNQGQTTRSYADIEADITGRWQEAAQKLAITKLKLKEWEETEKSNLKKELNNQLLSIQQSKAQTEADKTAKRMDVLNRALEEVRAINRMKIQADLQVQAQQRLMEADINKNLKPISQQTLNTQGYNPTSSALGAGNSQESGILSNIKYNKNLNRFEDEFGNPVLK